MHDGYEYCSRCPEHPCEKFGKFEEWFKGLGESLEENLRRIDAGEAEDWLGEQSERWKCQGCGEPVFWTQERCHSCGEPLK